MEKFSTRDPNQISQAEHDEKSGAKRVTIVGTDFKECFRNSFKDTIDNMVKDGSFKIQPGLGSINEYKQPMIIEKEVLVKEYELLKVPEIVTKYTTIEVPKIITEYKTIEVPVIIYKTEYKEIEKPIIIKETEIKIIEVEKKQENNSKKILILFCIGQLLILALSKFLSH